MTLTTIGKSDQGGCSSMHSRSIRALAGRRILFGEQNGALHLLVVYDIARPCRGTPRS